MPLFAPPVTVARPRSPISALNRPPISIYPREINEGTYASTAAQLGAAVVDGGTALHRQRTHSGFGASDLSLVFVNYNNYGAGEQNTSVSITVQATLEYPAGTFYPVLFGGQPSVAIAPNQTVVSDSLAVMIPANAYFYTRTFATVPAPGQASPGIPVGPPAIGDLLGVDPTYCGDNYRAHTGIAANANASNQLQTVGQNWLSTYGSYCYGPVAVIGTPLGAGMNRPVVAIVGDSVADWTADGQDGGFIARSLIAASIPFYRVARGSERALDFSATNGRLNRMLRIAACSTVVFEYGTNDVAGNITFATFRPLVLYALQACGAYGALVFVTTILPRTTSSDGYTTIAGQSDITSNLYGHNLVRQQVNVWYRAPASAGVGNSLAADLAAQGTALGGIIDIAAAVETTSAGIVPRAGVVIPGADRWYGTGGSLYSGDGVHPTGNTHISILAPLMPTGAFT